MDIIPILRYLIPNEIEGIQHVTNLYEKTKLQIFQDSQLFDAESTIILQGFLPKLFWCARSSGSNIVSPYTCLLFLCRREKEYYIKIKIFDIMSMRNAEEKNLVFSKDTFFWLSKPYKKGLVQILFKCNGEEFTCICKKDFHLDNFLRLLSVN